MGSVTTNPILIALINMTVVFAVLYGLSLVVRLIQVIDPTHKKKIDQSESPESLNTAIPVADTTSQEEDYDEMIILFTAAIAAYGYSGAKIVAIRPVGVTNWSQTARMEGVHMRNGMF
ncbi:MAG: sodium pump decarboxylase gamma subunit [Firmicutes bacterium]|nr:sodium pump decarboxylase gamma subunit [Bacillota bacterium]